MFSPLHPPFPCILFFFLYFFLLPFYLGGGECPKSLIAIRDAKGSGIFIAEELDGVGGKGSGNNKVVDIETFLKVFAGLPDLGIFF